MTVDNNETLNNPKKKQKTTNQKQRVQLNPVLSDIQVICLLNVNNKIISVIEKK